jgi:hypothetical protein
VLAVLRASTAIIVGIACPGMSGSRAKLGRCVAEFARGQEQWGSKPNAQNNSCCDARRHSSCHRPSGRSRGSAPTRPAMRHALIGWVTTQAAGPFFVNGLSKRSEAGGLSTATARTPLSICLRACDHIPRTRGRPSMHVSARIRRHPSLGLRQSRRLTSTWRHLPL